MNERRAWLYAFGWLGGGVAAGGFAAWLIYVIRWDWPSERNEQQLTILGNALYGMVALMALVILGLSIRNAIRNLKASALGASVEASGEVEG